MGAQSRMVTQGGIPRGTAGAVAAALVLGSLIAAIPAGAATLRGSQTSIRHQYQVARNHDFTMIRTSKQLRDFVAQGYLVELKGNSFYELDGVSYPYARPAVKTFLESLAHDYFYATGEKLVITSLARPLSAQPRNASRYSVHPTGMAADIRRTNDGSARRWIERRLLALENDGIIDATKEHRPPHYHIAVFPDLYKDYLAENDLPGIQGDDADATNMASAGETGDAEASGLARARTGSGDYATYRVRPGDSLWDIAQRHNTTVSRIRKLNGMRSSRIFPGETLMVPHEAR